MTRSLEREIQTAARAHTNLNVFASVVSILEGGSVYAEPGANEAAAQIMRICKRYQARALTQYDAAVARAKGHAR